MDSSMGRYTRARTFYAAPVPCSHWIHQWMLESSTNHRRIIDKSSTNHRQIVDESSTNHRQIVDESTNRRRIIDESSTNHRPMNSFNNPHLPSRRRCRSAVGCSCRCWTILVSSSFSWCVLHSCLARSIPDTAAGGVPSPSSPCRSTSAAQTYPRRATVTTTIR